MIAAAVGGLRDVVAHERTGLLVEGHDPTAYASAILRLFGDRRRAGRMREAAVEHAARFSWDATAAGIRDVYRELVVRRAG